MNDPATASNPQQLFLNSWHFLSFAALAVLVVRSCHGVARKLALLVLNGYFLFFFVGDLRSMLALCGLVLATFVVGEVQHRHAERLEGVGPLAIAVAAWGLLFATKNPDLAPSVNPFHTWPLRVIGTSYMVFRCMQYALDAELTERRSLLTLWNFVTFFPTLIAGPIERFERFQAFHDHGELLPEEPILPALHRVAAGFVKKFVLADNLAVFGVFTKTASEPWSVPALWGGTLLQLALLYLDFSGYCDIMIGLARLMRFQLCENFDRPWLARNIQEFWDRWHMSLTSFIRDYTFTPINLAIARRGTRWQFPLVAAAYFFCMMLIALWHRVSMGFVLFGVAHSIALVLVQVWRRFGQPRLTERSRRLLDGAALSLARRIATCVFVSLTMLLWNFGPVTSAAILRRMVGLG